MGKRMKKDAKISNAVIKRLPRYRRYLKELQKKGVDKISSNEFSSLIGYTASQIRQDLNNFGGFGQQGYGYNVEGLYNEISAILGLDKEYKMVIIGAGNLGQAIANHTYYYKAGFVVCGIFDINPRLEGLSVRGVEIRMMDELESFIKENHIRVATLTVPKKQARGIGQQLEAWGIKAIWNFAPTDLHLSDEVCVKNVHLDESLMTLSYNFRKCFRTKFTI